MCEEEITNTENFVILVEGPPDEALLRAVEKSLKEHCQVEPVFWPIKITDGGTLIDLIKLVSELSCNKVFVDKTNTKLHKEFEQMIHDDPASQRQLAGMIHYLD